MVRRNAAGKETVERAEDILFIARKAISAIRNTWSGGFEVQNSGEWQQFILENGKKTYQQYLPQLEAFMSRSK